MFGLLANALYTMHQGQSGGRGLSPRLWDRARGQMLTPDGFNNAYSFFDDFLSFQGVTLTTAAGQLQPPNGYFAYIEVDATVGSILQLATTVGGVIKLLSSTDAADGLDHQTVLGTGGNVGVMGVISDTAGADKMLIFEARIRVPSIANSVGSVFVGLGEEGLCAAATPLATDTTHKLASKDLIGFTILEDDGDALKFQYRKAGQATQTVGTFGTALAADTWYKVGFVYDPIAPESQRISWYVDNEEQTSKVTATNIAAATFPDGEELAMYASVIATADAVPHSLQLDWWAFFQNG